MSDGIARLRMFAGPNGSGKTTVKNSLGKAAEWFGAYINPDEIEHSIRTTGSLALAPYQLVFAADDLRQYFAASSFLKQQGLALAADALVIRDGALVFTGVEFNSYYASVLSDYLRKQLLTQARSFSFETVMSAEDKVDLLRDARTRGFRTYIYFVATEDPAINIDRVRHRVAAGGHDVPVAKIEARYYRSLELIVKAVRHASRAFFFDTSGTDSIFFAEITAGQRLIAHSEEIPNWFQPIWDSIPET
jgi:predicted ABC-type ATPase